jgi:beta-lactamase class A
MQARVQTALTIIADGKEFIIKPSKMQSWVYISHRPEQKTVEIGFDQRKIADSLRFLSAEIDYSVINTVTTLLNGIRAGHKEGTSGRSLRFDELVKTVAQTTSPATTSIEASVKTISPVEVIDRTYSRDSAGAQSLLDYWVGARSGQFGIDFRTVDGRISANINPNQIFSSVGVYRTYLASLVYNKLAAGSIYNSSQVNNGNTVRNCLSKMIIESDQSCTNALGDLVGWSASDSLLGSQGFESTTLTQNSSLSTANDSADWMIKLLSGGITQFSQANELTNLMSQQQYNSGMTAGSSGIRVADKTGVYGRNVNDVGIVYHPNGTYVLSVYSEGSSLSAIAELTRELNRLMSQ